MSTHPQIRKGSSLVPRNKSGNNPKAEYIEACKFLSDENLSQACSWLLSESTSLEQMAKEKAQILELYEKSVQAAKKIERDAPKAILPGLGGVRQPAQRQGSMTGATTGLAGKGKAAMARGRLGATSIQRRGSAGPSAGISRGAPPHKKARHPRSVSPPSKESKLPAPTNKPDVGKPASHAAPATSAPPQSALQFLAKLNKDSASSAEESAGEENGKDSRSSNTKTAVASKVESAPPPSDDRSSPSGDDEDEDHREESHEEHPGSAAKKTRSPPPTPETRTRATRVQPSRHSKR